MVAMSPLKRKSKYINGSLKRYVSKVVWHCMKIKKWKDFEHIPPVITSFWLKNSSRSFSGWCHWKSCCQQNSNELRCQHLWVHYRVQDRWEETTSQHQCLGGSMSSQHQWYERWIIRWRIHSVGGKSRGFFGVVVFLLAQVTKDIAGKSLCSQAWV